MPEVESQSKRWFRPPRLRTTERQAGERHASWLELFFDLVLVVAIAQVAHLFEQHPDRHGALLAGALFAAVFLAWQGFSFYADRFDSDDLPFRLATFVQMLALLALAVQMNDVARGLHHGFAITFALLRGVLVLLYTRAYFYAPVARPLIVRYGRAYGISVTLWLVSAFVAAPWHIAFWAAALLLDFSLPPLSIRLHQQIPVDPAHVPERFGLFTLIVLGELVVAVSIGTAESHWNYASIAVATAAFGIAVCLWWVYFERLPGQELQHSARRGVTYAYAHIPLLGALVYVAAGVSLLVQEENGDAILAGAWAVSIGVAVFLSALNFAQAQLAVKTERAAFRARSAASIVTLVLPLFLRAPLALVGSILLVLVALVTFESITCKPPEVAHAD